MPELHKTIKSALNEHITKLEDELDANIMSYTGAIDIGYLQFFRNFIESVASSTNRRGDKLIIILNSPGGVAEAVEKMVEIVRYHFQQVYFVVPDMAMSAGTIWCMSGDRIYMDYASSLGPIDPQVPAADGKLVPALGYLDQVSRLIEKSRNNTMTDAEFALLQNLDLSTLRRYEQAVELSVELLKTWLVKYKFKNWTEHRTTKELIGQPVTELQKLERAENVAILLSDHNRWHSHSRMIGINTIRDVLKLEIEDYSNNDKLRLPLRLYSELLIEHIRSNGHQLFLHHKEWF